MYCRIPESSKLRPYAVNPFDANSSTKLRPFEETTKICNIIQIIGRNLQNYYDTVATKGMNLNLRIITEGLTMLLLYRNIRKLHMKRHGKLKKRKANQVLLLDIIQQKYSMSDPIKQTTAFRS